MYNYLSVAITQQLRAQMLKDLLLKHVEIGQMNNEIIAIASGYVKKEES